jgi:hypothetical protein
MTVTVTVTVTALTILDPVSGSAMGVPHEP